MSKTIYIVGAGELGPNELKIPDGAFIIAADGGLEHLQRAGIIPNLIVGDFDSLGFRPEGKNVIFHQPEKNDTDTLLAVNQALSLGADTIVIYGGLGGRFDHSIANLQTLHYIKNRGTQGFLIGCGSICTVIRDEEITFSEQLSGYVSVFSISEISSGVYIRGLKYPLTNHTLASEMPLGVSNEFAGKPSAVSVKSGALAVMWQGTSYRPEHFSVCPTY